MRWYQRLGSWTLHTRPVSWAMRDVLPNLVVPFWPHGLSRKARKAGQAIVRRGDILLSDSPMGVSSLLTRGLDHAALCMAEDGPLREVAEMTADGFGTVCWRDFCDHARRVVICRCEDWDAEYVNRVIVKCISFQSREYDLQFELGDSELTCAELVYEADFEHRLHVEPMVNLATGAEFVDPQQILDAENVKVVWDSAGKLKGKVKP